MKQLDDFIDEILADKKISLGSVSHGFAKDIICKASELYAQYRVDNAMHTVLSAIYQSQHELTNDSGDRTGVWVTDEETIKNIDFKTLLTIEK